MQEIAAECVSPAWVTRSHMKRIVLIIQLPCVPIDQAGRVVHETGGRRKMILGSIRFAVKRVTKAFFHLSNTGKDTNKACVRFGRGTDRRSPQIFLLLNSTRSQSTDYKSLAQ